jgi:hydroxyethylthiazole kinase-like uncharacterized protein yjeF
MKILSAQQIREAEAYSIKNEPISSIDLMERAATACAHWIYEHLTDSSNKTFKIICGTGNNGGDGLALARLLNKNSFRVEVWVVRHSTKSSEDFLINEKRLKEANIDVHDIRTAGNLPTFNKNDYIIDAIFGTGLSKPVIDLAAQVIDHINHSPSTIIAIDMPSGLFADQHTSGEAIVHAAHTLSFQAPKLAFMFSENEKYVGDFHVLDINLDEKFIEQIDSTKEYITQTTIKPMLKKRGKFSHKGNYGHAVLVAGGYGKMGAAVLATRACLRTGAGLTTAHVPKCGYEIIQAAAPEAMAAVDSNEENLQDTIDADMLAGITAIGMGPGIGTLNSTKQVLKNLLSTIKAADNSPSLILDADALNILSMNKELLSHLPAGTILTPHPKEFTRLAGETKNYFERHELQIQFSKQYKVWVVLKGAHTCTTSPEGRAWFNSTGNAGMAKGGSGDVLTGVITSLLAQGYDSYQAAVSGVYLHGLAGDIAASQKGMDGMIAGDIINCIPEAFVKIRG